MCRRIKVKFALDRWRTDIVCSQTFRSIGGYTRVKCLVSRFPLHDNRKHATSITLKQPLVKQVKSFLVSFVPASSPSLLFYKLTQESSAPPCLTAPCPPDTIGLSPESRQIDAPIKARTNDLADKRPPPRQETQTQSNPDQTRGLYCREVQQQTAKLQAQSLRFHPPPIARNGGEQKADM